MRKGLITATWLTGLAVIWFLSLVAHAMAFNSGGIHWLIKLLGIFWLIYLAGLWFEQSGITDTAWAMLLGYAIGCIRMLDMIPNQQEYILVKFVPVGVIQVLVLAFIFIFIGVLPLVAGKVIKTHKENQRVLDRDN